MAMANALHRPTGPGAGAYAVGIEILPYELVAVLADETGRDLDARRWPIAEMETKTVVEQVADAATELVDTTLGIALTDRRVCLGLQIGGPVDTDNGRVLAYANHPTDSMYAGRDYHWREPVPLAAMVAEQTGCATVIENDGAAFATLEKHFGVGRRTESFAVVLIRDGVGGGIVLDGHLMKIPFEFGHIKVRPEGRWCVSGDRGCIDAYAGRRAVRAIAGEVTGAESDLESIMAAIILCDQPDGGAPAVLSVFRQAGEAVGHGIATVLSLFGLSHIVVYGPPDMVDPESGRAAAEAFASGIRAFPSLTYPLFRSAQVLIKPMGVKEGAHGAALVAIDRLIGNGEMEGSDDLR